jgi:hypothetical protein
MATTNSNSKELGYTFIPTAKAVMLIDLKLKLIEPSKGKLSERQINRDELAVYLFMENRMNNHFAKLGMEYFDSYADIGKATRISERTVEKIVPRLKRAGLFNYRFVWLEGRTKSKNIYTYIIDPMTLVQRYEGAVIDILGEEAVVTYRTGSNQAPALTDIPQVLLEDKVYSKKTTPNTVSKPVEAIIEKPTLIDEYKPTIQPKAVQQPEEQIDDIAFHKMKKEFKANGCHLQWDEDCNAYMLSQGEQTIEVFSGRADVIEYYNALNKTVPKKKAVNASHIDDEEYDGW